MTDTATRLRLYAQQFEDQHAPQPITLTLREAADEIKALQDEIAHLRGTITDALLELSDGQVTRAGVVLNKAVQDD